MPVIALSFSCCRDAARIEEGSIFSFPLDFSINIGAGDTGRDNETQ